MYNISKQILTQENIRLLVAKYFSTSKVKKPDNLKNSSSKKLCKNKQNKFKILKISNAKMETFSAEKNANLDNNDKTKNCDVRKENFNKRLPPAYSKFRHWEITEGGRIFYRNSENKATGLEFTLVSYNILAQNLLEEHAYLYQYHKSETLNWHYRLAKLTDELISLNPQIICLQEVQFDHLEALKKKLQILNCDCIFKKKTRDRTDGCAIFYNRNIFQLEEYKSVEYFQPFIERLSRDNVGLIAKLSPKANPDDYFIVATTHLLYNPKRQDVRLAQIQILLAELDQISFKEFKQDCIPERYPIILTGDFNLEPYSAPYKLITAGELEYRNLTRLTLEKPEKEKSGNVVGKIFLPKNLRITDNCQYIDVVADNYTKKATLEKLSYHQICEEKDSDLVVSCPHLFSSGFLRHGLNLKSVYHHENSNNENYVSTYQDQWITVDYIFYSKQFNYDLGTFNDSKLKLLSRYVLPTDKVCKKMGMIPNTRLGSDHLALAVTFFLKN